MTRGSSINFKKGSAGFEHNDRTEEHEAKHLLPIEHRLENECDRSATESRELLKEMVENAKEKYQERTGQKLQAKILTVEAAINLEDHHTLKDVEKINEYLEQKHGLRAVQSSIHRDEGHINDEGKPEYNLHAHVVYCNLDKDGKTVLKGLEKDDLRELQTFVADTLKMQRGQSAEITNAKHKSPQEFRHEKVLATNKDLKAEIAQLREQFKEQGATRADYAQIEQLQKELKEQIKAKELTVDQLKEQSNLIATLQKENEALKSELSEEKNKTISLQKDILEISTTTHTADVVSIKNSKDILIQAEPINDLLIQYSNSPTDIIDGYAINDVAMANREALKAELKKKTVTDLLQECTKTVGTFRKTEEFNKEKFVDLVQSRENTHNKLHKADDLAISAFQRIANRAKDNAQKLINGIKTHLEPFLKLRAVEQIKELAVPQRDKDIDLKKATDDLNKMLQKSPSPEL
jgi:hypothetical protein